MADQTSLGFRYPELGDTYVPHADFKNLADDVDDELTGGSYARVQTWDDGQEQYVAGPAMPTIYIGPDEPTGAVDGDLWFDTSEE